MEVQSNTYVKPGMIISLQSGWSGKYCSGVTRKCTASKATKDHNFLVVPPAPFHCLTLLSCVFFTSRCV